MAEYEIRDRGNGDRYENDYGGASSLAEKSSSFNETSKSRSLVDSWNYERGSSKKRDRERNQDRDTGSDRDRDRGKYRDRDRQDHKDRERSERRNRHHNRDDDDYGCRYGRVHDRHRGYDRNGEARPDHRSRSHSHSRSQSKRRSRSRSRSRSESKHRSRSRSRSGSKRISGFDMAPPASAQTVLFPGLPALVQSMTQQATRHARRVYVGGLPPAANEQTIAAFFNQVMSAIGGNTSGMGDAVMNVYINHEKKFAFVEMRTVEEASNAMALDGISLEGAPVKVRRPTDYNASQAAALGPTQPNPNLNLAAVGLTREGPADRIFVGGLQYYLTEQQIRELLETFGPLRFFELVKDQGTGNSKGYAFCVYEDLSVTDTACVALNGIKMGEKTLTVRRANQNAAQPSVDQLQSILLQAQQHQLGLQQPLLPTKVVCLIHAVSVAELKDDQEYEDILEDMRDEGGRYGKLVNIVIPRPGPNGEPSPGVGKVFLAYADTDGSIKARVALDGRKFGGNQVVAVYYPEEKLAQGDYDG